MVCFITQYLYIVMCVLCRLDGKHVVFGKVLDMDVVNEIQKFGSKSGKTSKKILIAACGQLS